MHESTSRSFASVVAIFLTLLVAVLSWTDANAQASSKSDLRGTWLVKVEHDVRPRILVITDAPDQTGVTTAVYGYSDNVSQQAAIQVRLEQSAKRRMSFLTHAAGVIEVTEGADGTFTGTLTSRGGAARGVTISRATDDELAAARRNFVDPVPMAPEVPQECAAFQGLWKGRWTRGGQEVSLNIPEVSSDGKGGCIFRFGMSSASAPPAARRLLNARPGESPSYPCGNSQTCAFGVVLGDMWFSVTKAPSYDMSDNRAVLHKVSR